MVRTYRRATRPAGPPPTLRERERAERYRVMREESLALRDDPAELAEIAAIREDLHGLR